MTAADSPPTPNPRADRSTEERYGAELDRGVLPVLCPFLATEEGTWRSARAVREHRCMAVSPPVPLAAEKQRRLCLVDAHVDCATYGAAMAARADPPARQANSVRPVARMTPVILDQGRFDIRMPAVRSDRASQGILVGLLGVAFAAVLLARPADPAGAGPVVEGGSPAPSTDVAASTEPTDPPATPTAKPSASEAPATAEASGTAPSPTPDPTPSPQVTARPTLSGDTYRVKSGDTLTAIAARFGTTTNVLVQLNGIADPSNLRVGQILILP